jgi:hypothetical protein
MKLHIGQILEAGADSAEGKHTFSGRFQGYSEAVRTAVKIACNEAGQGDDL